MMNKWYFTNEELEMILYMLDDENKKRYKRCFRAFWRYNHIRNEWISGYTCLEVIKMYSWKDLLSIEMKDLSGIGKENFELFERLKNYIRCDGLYMP